MRRPAHSKAREELIDKLEKTLSGKARSLQSSIMSCINEELAELSLDDGVIKETGANFRSIARLDKAVSSKVKKQVDALIKWIVNRIKEIADLNGKQIAAATLAHVRKANNDLLRSFGLRLSGSEVVVGDGFIKDLTDFSEPIRVVKSNVRAAVGSNVLTLPVLKKNIKRRVVGVDRLGIVERRIFERAPETFSLIDRSIGTNIAKQNGIRAAIFQGGIIKTTRSFCKDHNNKVFTFDEIAAFADLEWQGKNSNYNPQTDMGGINCRHQWDFITDDLAIILRPELKDIWGL